ncbi:hypothetical protein A3709_19345 [Halioglobus sp. HI00S01]|uniref:hypothetical protein n=1 Tax=Halioglobus sp. HI00S01 TaxID=1822214 RepID=UPI0007C22591|nr:hypothetical protein [Halioglobus sp. HI00S01]KZX57780.1 hypothetical protein A3709_19345 [Halioglobus sp. HI00S01]
MKQAVLDGWLKDNDVQSIHVVTFHDDDSGSLELRNSSGERVGPPSGEFGEKAIFNSLSTRGMLEECGPSESVARLTEDAHRRIDHHGENGPNFEVTRAYNDLDQLEKYAAWKVVLT